MTGDGGVSAGDRGFQLGDGLFETVRVYGGVPFRLADHLQRLRRAATRIRIRIPGNLDERVAQALTSPGSPGDGALRITLTRGEGAGLLPPEPPPPPTLRVVVRPWRPDPSWEVEGLTARILGRVDEGALTVGLKGIGYLERIVALMDAREGGAPEALLRNGAGRVVGGSASNLFLVEGGRLRTPGLGEGILPGITREVVLGLAGELGLEVVEGAPTPEELRGAEELFLTSSLRELVPVVGVEGRPVGPGVPGPVWRRLLQAYRRRVGEEVGR